MKKKSFDTLRLAYKHFKTLPEDSVAFLVHNKEDGVFEVINQELYDHYQNDVLLDMELLDYMM